MTSPGIPAQQLKDAADASRRVAPLPTRARRPGLIALAVLLVAGFALSGAVLVARAGDTTEVLVASHAVPAGHVIESGDVRAARLAGTVRAIAAADLQSVVGSTAAVGLVPGQVLNRDMLTSAPVPAEGKSLIGLALKPGQFPADGLAIGDQVLVVLLPDGTGTGTDAGRGPAASATGGTARAITVGELYGLRPDPSTGSDTLVTLIVPLNTANRIVEQGAAGRVSLVKVTPGASAT